jgi:hypothetical protein
VLITAHEIGELAPETRHIRQGDASHVGLLETAFSILTGRIPRRS